MYQRATARITPLAISTLKEQEKPAVEMTTEPCRWWVEGPSEEFRYIDPQVVAVDLTTKREVLEILVGADLHESRQCSAVHPLSNPLTVFLPQTRCLPRTLQFPHRGEA